MDHDAGVTPMVLTESNHLPSFQQPWRWTERLPTGKWSSHNFLSASMIVGGRVTRMQRSTPFALRSWEGLGLPARLLTQILPIIRTLW